MAFPLTSFFRAYHSLRLFKAWLKVVCKVKVSKIGCFILFDGKTILNSKYWCASVEFHGQQYL